jgi:TonB family protein
MRRILAASLLLSPLLCTAAAVASQPVIDASASTQAPRISTGVIPARLLHAASLTLPPTVAATTPDNAEVVLKLNVDEQGKAQDIQVVRSVSPALDENVVEAVRQFRWRPASLDKQAIPVELTLKVEVQH